MNGWTPAMLAEQSIADRTVPRHEPVRPGALATTLWRHQREAVDFALARKAALLDMGMGTGKSLSAIAVACESDARLVVILCPVSVVGVWRREFQRHAPGAFDVRCLDDGTCAAKAEVVREQVGLAKARGRRLVLVCNYESAWRPNLARALLNNVWSLLICDEIHRIKTPSSRASLFCEKLARQCRRKLGLTGTPAPHSPLDLYGQFRALEPTIFGRSFVAFKARYGAIRLVPGGGKIWASMPIVRTVKAMDGSPRPAGHWLDELRAAAEASPVIDAYLGRSGMGRWLESRPKGEELVDRDEVLRWLRQHVWITATDFSDARKWPNQEEFRRKYRAITYECSSESVLDLPPVTEQTITVQLSAKARRAYDRLEADFWTEVERGEVTAANALVKLLRLASLACGHVRLDDGTITRIDDAKRRALADLLEDVPPDVPVAVFCRFVADLDAVREAAAAAGRTYGEISGRTKDALDQHACLKEGVGVVGTQMAAGGVGIDLTRAAVAVFYSLGFSLGDYLQARARLHRPGQLRHVTFVNLVAEETVDETVLTALARRQQVIEAVLGGRGRHADGRPAAA